MTGNTRARITYSFTASRSLIFIWVLDIFHIAKFAPKYPTSGPWTDLHQQTPCSDSRTLNSTPSNPLCFDVLEKPLCQPLWPLDDLPLPADRALNIASPPVETVWRTGPSSKPWSDWAMITMGTWLISSCPKDWNVGEIRQEDTGFFSKENSYLKPLCRCFSGSRRFILIFHLDSCLMISVENTLLLLGPLLQKHVNVT